MWRARHGRQLRTARTRSATSTRATTTSRPPSYDSKWGIDFGEVGQAQVLGKLRKVLGSELDRGFDRSLEIGAGTGYFSLNLLQAGVVARGDLHRHLARGWCATLADERGRGSGCEVRTAARRRRVAAVRRRELRPRARPRGAPPPPRPRRARSTSSIACCARRADRVRRRALARRRPARGDAQAGRERRSRRCGARCCAPRPRRRRPTPGESGHGAHDHGLERLVDIHAFAPGELVAPRQARRVRRTSRSAARSSSRTGSGGSTARSRRAPIPDQVPMLWRQYAFHGYLLLQRARRARARAGAAAGDLLQPAASPRAGPRRLETGRDARTAHRATSRCSRSGSWRSPASWSRCTSSRSATRR